MMPCRHRGAALAMQVNAGCRKYGKTIATYVCEVHGKCAKAPVKVPNDITKIDRSVKPCHGCKDRKL